jgi:murein DD-endopeptidase MepM/ murein hydrolase activator NlpD
MAVNSDSLVANIEAEVAPDLPPSLAQWFNASISGARKSATASMGASTLTAVIPRFIKEDLSVPGYTFYIEIDIGTGTTKAGKPFPLNLTGIYIPDHFNPANPCCLVLYLHGMTGGKPGELKRIDEYWIGSKYPEFALREEVRASGANVIFVAPSLGRSPNVYPNHLSNKDGGLDDYLGKVLFAVTEYYLRQHRLSTAAIQPEKILLSAHSAGGAQMRKIALRQNLVYEQKIKECWGFDSLYGGVSEWVQWKKKYPSNRLFIYYLGSTADNAVALQRKNLPNVFVQRSSKGHYWVPVLHLRERIAAACGGQPEGAETEFEAFADYEHDTVAAPKAVPSGSPIPFAPEPQQGSYWPIVSSVKQGRLVSYETVNGENVGNPGRKFLANRTTKEGTPRNHVGIDLYANFNDPVVACEDGVILKFGYFYSTKKKKLPTNLLTIRHKNVIVNYGEVGPSSFLRLGLKVGDQVKAGQVIGFVGATGMLHFETYHPMDLDAPQRWLKGDAPPALLFNPTRYLLFLQKHGLTGSGVPGSAGDAAPAQPAAGSSNGSFTFGLIPPLDWVMEAATKLALPVRVLLALLTSGKDKRKAIAEITDLVFYQRHPELEGRSLKNDLADAALRSEWAKIKADIATPMVEKALSSIPQPPLATVVPVPGLGSPLVPKILELVAASPLVKYRWKDRGRSPIGYLKGMALTYARVYCNYQTGLGLPQHSRDKFAFEMAKGAMANSNTTKDAIARYASQFRQLGADVRQDGAGVLRSLFTILFGLGMRESSGKHCAGWDRGKLNGWGNPEKAVEPSPTNSEAGIFQISYDIGMDKGLFKELYDKYKSGQSPSLLAYFSEGVSCNAKDKENFGTGVGMEFQQFSKDYPAFTAELAALALRTRANHWGPIRKNTAELLPDTWKLLTAIENAVDNLGGCANVK